MLDAPALFSVAYGEIASSLYFALGIVALHALGLAPAVLLAAGLLFVIVAFSYAEGTTSIPETGGAATVVRRGFNDLLGFVTGWALFLDYLIVIALSTLFLPHYLAVALSAPSLRESPWDVVVAVCVIAGIGLLRLVRRTQIHAAGLVVAGLDLATQLLLVVLGVAFLLDPDVLTHGIASATAGWRERLCAAVAMPAFTGLERWPTWRRIASSADAAAQHVLGDRARRVIPSRSPSSASRRFPRRTARQRWAAAAARPALRDRRRASGIAAGALGDAP